MGRKRGGDGPSAGRSRNQAVSLREESSGKTQADAASLLRVQHLQRLAAWAGGEAGVGPVGALLGRRLAANAEAAGVPVGASTFLCQRCETVLQPGFNCTIRIKNDKRKGKRRKKSNSCQNSVSYLCHFCGDQNLIWGSGKRIVTNLLSSRKSVSMDSTSILLKENSRNGKLTQSSLKKDEHGERPKSNLTKDSMVEGVVSSSVEISQLAADTDQDITQKIVVESANEKCMHEAEPVSADNIKICESNVPLKAEYPVGSKFITPQKNKLTDPKDSDLIKMRSMQNSGSATSSSKSAPNDSAQVSGSSRKRARKGWTTLKQIAEKDELEKKEKMGNFVIPFFMQ